MIFHPDLAKKVLAGEKTVTRRLVSDNPRSPWFSTRCVRVGRDYAVCPGRGKEGIGRVRIIDVRQAVLGDVDATEARKEGFRSREAFVEAWTAINGCFDPYAAVWRVEFEVLT